MPSLRFIIHPLIWIAMSLALSECITAGTTVTITSPDDGVTVERNKEHIIAVTASDAIGVTRVELWDAGVVALTSHSTVPEGQTLFIVNFAWTPKDNGTHVLVVKAYNRDSDQKESALKVLTIQVADTVPVPGGATPTNTATPGSTLTPTRTNTPGPSLTPSVTSTPTTSPTLTPPATGTPTIPGTPSAFAATGAGTTIQFSWVDNSTNELGFRIYEQGVVAPVVDGIPAHLGTGGMAYDWKNVPCNTSTNFVVKSYNALGESPASNAVNVVTIPCAPSNLVVTPATSTSINLAFMNSSTNEAGYRVYQTSSSTALGTITAAPGPGAKSGSITNLLCGNTAAYFVRAFNAAGESSNSNTSEVTTLPCNVTVTFTQIHVIDDSNPKPPSCGGPIPCNATLYLDFTVNTQAKRFPATGTMRATTGDTLSITGIAYTFSLVRGQNLAIGVNGTDQHTFQPSHPLGTITKSHLGSDNWNAGTHTEKSTCPGGCYEITYTIEVKP